MILFISVFTASGCLNNPDNADKPQKNDNGKIIENGILNDFENTEKNDVIQNYKIFRSREECEEETGRECGFIMCDYIPEGKTFEEVCGENFEPGWTPIR